MACRYEQREFIGIEREPEYADIAERRIAAVAPLFAERSSTGDPSGEGLLVAAADRPSENPA